MLEQMQSADAERRLCAMAWKMLAPKEVNELAGRASPNSNTLEARVQALEKVSVGQRVLVTDVVLKPAKVETVNVPIP